jgi:opacity protein-like surface antigen
MHVRSLFAVALAALLVGPAAAHAQAKRTSSKAAAAPSQTTTTSPNYSIGGWIGYETDDPFGGVQVRGDFVWPFERLAPALDLSFVGSVGLSYLSHSESSFGVSVDASAWEFKLVPTARFTYTINPQFSVFGDAGIGINYTSVSVDTNFGLGTQSASDSSTGLLIRLGAGAFFAVAPKVKLGAMVVVDPSTGSNNLDTWSFLAGANFQL